MWFAFIAFEHSLQALCLFCFLFVVEFFRARSSPRCLGGTIFAPAGFAAGGWLAEGGVGRDNNWLLVLSIDVHNQLSSTNSTIPCKSSGIMMEHIRAMQVIFLF